MMQPLALLLAVMASWASPAAPADRPAAEKSEQDPTLGVSLFGPMLYQFRQLDRAAPEMVDPAAQRKLLADMLDHLDRANEILLGAVIQDRDRPVMEAMLQQAEAGNAVPRDRLAKLLEELDVHERVAMDRIAWLYSKQAHQTFRDNWDEFYRRSTAWEHALSNWEKAGSPAHQRYRLTAWLLAATRNSSPGSIAPVPDPPRFGIEATVQVAQKFPETVESPPGPSSVRQSSETLPRITLPAQSPPKPEDPASVAAQEPLRFPEVEASPPSPDLSSERPTAEESPPPSHTLAVEIRPPAVPIATPADALRAPAEEVVRQDGAVETPPAQAAAIPTDRLTAIPPALPSRRVTPMEPRLDDEAAAPRGRKTRQEFLPVSAEVSGIAPGRKEPSHFWGRVERLPAGAQMVSRPALPPKTAAARVNLSELTSRIMGNNIDLDALSAELDQGGAWTADRIARLVSRLQLLSARGRDLGTIYQLLEEDEQRVVATPRRIEDLIPRLGTRIFEARTRTQGAEFRGSPADRDAERKILDQLSEVLVDLAR